MIALIAYYWIWLLGAFLIGLATAWWVWRTDSVTANENDRIVWPGNEAGDERGVEDLAQPVVENAGIAVPATVDSAAEPAAEAPAPFAVPVQPEIDSSAPPAESAPDTNALDLTGEEMIAPPVDLNAPDDLTIVNGIGPQLNTLLGSLGITRFDQIANWGPEEIERIDSHLGVFRGRIIRDDWIQQARLLVAGDFATFNERYGEQ